MTEPDSTTDVEPAVIEPAVVEPEPETPTAYWQRMADASGTTTAIPDGTQATVTCTNAGCTHQGAWYPIPATQQGPVHCGGCFAVLHCDHDDTATTATYAGTVGSPLIVTVTSCNTCHSELTRTQVPIAPTDVPLALVQALHNA